MAKNVTRRILVCLPPGARLEGGPYRSYTPAQIQGWYEFVVDSAKQKEFDRWVQNKWLRQWNDVADKR